MIFKTESSHHFSALIHSGDNVFESRVQYRFYQMMKT
jgi:hypothetical protein